jgi:hypothetical protein
VCPASKSVRIPMLLPYSGWMVKVIEVSRYSGVLSSCKDALLLYTILHIEILMDFVV